MVQDRPRGINGLDNRISVGLCLGAFVIFSFFCISAHAPMIEEDISARCREVLVANHIRPNGMSVSGRDVMLTGLSGSLIVSPSTRIMLQRVSGVRSVATQVTTTETNETNQPPAAVESRPEETTSDEVREVQNRINSVLQSQQIEFKPDSATLTPQSKAVLNSVVSILVRAPNLRCEIRGNSNSASDAQREWMMTLQRALATEDYLVSKGVADWRLSAQVYRAGAGSGASVSRDHGQIDFFLRER